MLALNVFQKELQEHSISRSGQRRSLIKRAHDIPFDQSVLVRTPVKQNQDLNARDRDSNLAPLTDKLTTFASLTFLFCTMERLWVWMGSNFLLHSYSTLKTPPSRGPC